MAFLLVPQSFAPLFAPLTQYGAPPIYDQGNLLSARARAPGHGVPGGGGEHRGGGRARDPGARVRAAREFLPLSRTLVNIGQTFPPVAVLAVTVPLVGFGEKPTLIALFAYGLLPIFENTIVALQTDPAGGARGRQRHGHERPPAPAVSRAASGDAVDS